MTMISLFISVWIPPTHALEWPRFRSTEISQVLVEKHSPQSNIHLDFDLKHGKRQIIDLPFGNELSTHRRFNPAMYIQTLNFQIDIEAQTNLPAGHSLKATLRGKVIFKGGDNYTIRMNKIYVAGKKFKKKDLDCTPLIYISPHMGRMIFELKDEKGLAGCIASKDSNLDPTQIGKRDLNENKGNFYTNNQDSVLGASYSRQFIAENQNVVLPDSHPTSIYAQGLMNRIAQASDKPEIEPQVHVINANVLNAFALPGGHVFVFRGLLDASETEAQLAGVLGHEWAHVTTRHGTRGMSRHLAIMGGATIGSMLLGILGYNSKNNTVRSLTPLMQYAVQIAGVALIMKFSRDQEEEADKLGAQYAWNAGFPPYGIGQMFEVFSKEDPSGKSKNFLETAFSSHPAHSERIATNYLYSGLYYPTLSHAGSNFVSSAAYQNAKNAMNGVAPLSDDDSKQIMVSIKESLTSFSETELKNKFKELHPNETFSD